MVFYLQVYSGHFLAYKIKENEKGSELAVQRGMSNKVGSGRHSGLRIMKIKNWINESMNRVYLERCMKPETSFYLFHAQWRSVHFSSRVSVTLCWKIFSCWKIFLSCHNTMIVTHSYFEHAAFGEMSSTWHVTLTRVFVTPI